MNDSKSARGDELRENKYLFDINIHCVVWVDRDRGNTTCNKIIVYAVIKEPKPRQTRLPETRRRVFLSCPVRQAALETRSDIAC